MQILPTSIFQPTKGYLIGYNPEKVDKEVNKLVYLMHF